jgi:hypothetical protein
MTPEGILCVVRTKKPAATKVCILRFLDPFDQGLLCSKWIILNPEAFSTFWIPNSRELVIVFFCGKQKLFWLHQFW